MPVRTKKLASGQLAATGGAAVDTVVYTAPAGETVIVKSVALVAPDGAMAPKVLLRDATPTFVNVATPSLAQNVGYMTSAWLVLLPGEAIVLNQPANVGRLRYWISGTELEGTAD